MPGYINIDFPSQFHSVQTESKADVQADIRELVYPVGSVDEIRSHHMFEHFDRPTAMRLLIDWYKWLKIGGLLIIETPDIERCSRAFYRGRNIKKQLALLRHMFGSHEAAWAIHSDGWYKNRFNLYLESLGYGDLSFDYSKWCGLYNIKVTAKKLAPTKTDTELRREAESLLRYSLVDDSSKSEQRLLEIWIKQLDSFTRQSDD